MALRLGLSLGLLPAGVTAPPTSVPVNVVAPSIIGIATQGQTLTCLPGSWAGTPSGAYAYQWKRDGTNIGGATAATRVVALADVGHALTCQVIASNIIGPSAPAISNSKTIVAALAISITPPPGVVGSAYSALPVITGGRGPYTTSLTGTPPAGAGFNGVTGEISAASLVTSGTSSGLNITVTDADGLQASTGPFSIVVTVGGGGTNGKLDFHLAANSGRLATIAA